MGVAGGGLGFHLNMVRETGTRAKIIWNHELTIPNPHLVTGTDMLHGFCVLAYLCQVNAFKM